MNSETLISTLIMTAMFIYIIRVIVNDVKWSNGQKIGSIIIVGFFALQGINTLMYELLGTTLTINLNIGPMIYNIFLVLLPLIIVLALMQNKSLNSIIRGLLIYLAALNFLTTGGNSLINIGYSVDASQEILSLIGLIGIQIGQLMVNLGAMLNIFNYILIG